MPNSDDVGKCPVFHRVVLLADGPINCPALTAVVVPDTMSNFHHGFGRRLLCSVVTVCFILLSSCLVGLYVAQQKGTPIQFKTGFLHPINRLTPERPDVQERLPATEIVSEDGNDAADESVSIDTNTRFKENIENLAERNEEVKERPGEKATHQDCDESTGTQRADQNSAGEFFREEGSGDGVPDVDDCNLCFLCHRDKPATKSFKVDPDLQAQTSLVQRVNEAKIRSQMGTDPDFQIFRAADKSQKPNCSECYGCTENLEFINSTVTFLGKDLRFEHGASPVWVLRARSRPMTERSTRGEAVVKVWCVPVLKAHQSGFTACNATARLNTAKLLTSLDTLAEECGFEEIISKAWPGPVNGIINGTGYHINWDGLWMEPAPGVSLEMFFNSHQVSTKVRYDFLKKVNSTQVKLAAIFDLLFSQCDRHAQNVFLDEQGKLTLIDNDVSLQSTQEKCGVDSLFLPTTEEYAINQQSFGFVMKRIDKPQPQPSLRVLLDYRCHVEGGKIGFAYPKKTKQCMQKFADMSVEDLQLQYRLPEARSAQALKDRAEAMLQYGFEKALEDSKPYNLPQKRYPWFTPCCEFRPLDGFPEAECLNPDWRPDTRHPLLL